LTDTEGISTSSCCQCLLMVDIDESYPSFHLVTITSHEIPVTPGNAGSINSLTHKAFLLYFFHEETKFLSNQTYDPVVKKTDRLEEQGRHPLVRAYPPCCATQSHNVKNYMKKKPVRKRTESERGISVGGGNWLWLFWRERRKLRSEVPGWV